MPRRVCYCFFFCTFFLYNTREIDQMQRVENKAYRTILNLPLYTAVEFLRGEIGSSSIIAN